MKQLPMRFRTHGGKRKNAGRKPNGARAGVSHLPRERFARLLPVHVTLRVASHVYNMRSRRCFSVLARAFAAAAERFGVRIVQFSVRGNHVHLVVEASSSDALARAMKGFSVRVARGLNRVMSRSGRVLGDRYHAHLLRTPTEARRALATSGETRSTTVSSRAANAMRTRRMSPKSIFRYPHTWLLRAGFLRAPPGPRGS